MQFKRKVLALKETERGFSVNGKKLSGVCRLEFENGLGEIFLTPINALDKSSFSYGVLIFDGKNDSFVFELPCLSRPLRAKIFDNFSLDGGIAVGVYAFNDDGHKTILFAKEESCKLSINTFNKTVADNLSTKKTREELTNTQPQIQPQEERLTNTQSVTQPQDYITDNERVVASAYDDEAVATENYFELDEQIDKKLNFVKEWTLEKVRIEDGEPSFASDKEKAQIRSYFDRAQNETHFIKSAKSEDGKPYFLTVRKELDALFEKFPREDSLEKTFLNSRWARVYYSNDKYYVVGLIKEDGKEKYICYGVPATYSKNPPKELDGYCTFIPLSVFNLNGDGFWMMFQDAVTGKCITPNIID